MQIKKPKLRLRKQFVIASYVLIALLFVTTITIIANNHSYAATVEKVETASSTTEEVITTEQTKNILNDNIYLTNYSNFINNVQKDNTIIYYANKFKLKEKVVLELAKNLTENYTKETYVNSNVIGSDKVIASIGSFNSFEAGVAYFVRDLYRNPARYGTDMNTIVASYDTDIATRENGTIYMSNGYTFEQYYGKIADLFGIDKTTALAMVYHESGNMKSGLAIYNNNIGGMKGASGWLEFPTLEAGVIAHVLTIKSISDKNGFNISDPDGISKFSGIYVHGDETRPALEWIEKVNYYKERIIAKDVFTIE